MQPVYDVVTNGTGVDLNRLLHTVEDGGGISTTVDANETMSDMENPPFLKQPLHMVIIYTLAYSAVFILGIVAHFMGKKVIYLWNAVRLFGKNYLVDVFYAVVKKGAAK